MAAASSSRSSSSSTSPKDALRLLEAVKRMASGRGAAIETMRTCRQLASCLEGSTSSVAAVIDADGHLALLGLLRQYYDRVGPAIDVFRCLTALAADSASATRSRGLRAPDVVAVACRAVAELLRHHPGHADLHASGLALLCLLCASSAGCIAAAESGATELALAGVRRCEKPALELLVSLSVPAVKANHAQSLIS